MKADEAALRRAAAERRRLAEVFGDVLAEGAGGDDDEHDGAGATAERRDADLLRDVPPHHGA